MSQCTGKSKRSGKRCLKWAIRGKKVCRAHGGRSKGATTKIGREKSRAAVLKHGMYTQEAVEQNRRCRALIQQSKELLHSLSLE